MHFNWIIGFSGTRDVFFLSRANSTARCRVFLAEFFQVYIVFLVVAIFAKTECYSPSNLLVRSAMCRTSATYQLSTCRKWYVQHSKHSMIILVMKPISITPVLSLARKASEKILPVKTITQGKSKPLVENMFLYQSSYWGMSTLAVPVLVCLWPINIWLEHHSGIRNQRTWFFYLYIARQLQCWKWRYYCSLE